MCNGELGLSGEVARQLFVRSDRKTEKDIFFMALLMNLSVRDANNNVLFFLKVV